ncbi:unnamed protein product, partial [Phaeothamnion confervicola]
LFRQIQLEQRAQVEALQGLGQSPTKSMLTRHITSLRSASERLLELFPLLQKEESKEQMYSPFPVIDHTIRVGINLLDGKVSDSDFQTRLPSVGALISSLRQDVERFRLLYGKAELVAQTGPILERLEAGLGAAYTYVGNQDKIALQDSLRLLGSAGVQLMEVLQKFDEAGKNEVRFHQLRFLEEFARAAQLENPPEWMVGRIWMGLDQALEYYKREMTTILRHPVFFEIETAFQPVDATLKRTLALYAAANKGKIAKDSLILLAPAVEQLDAEFKALQQQHQAAAFRYREAPNLDAVRELIGRTLNGEVGAAQFVRQLAEVQEAHQEMLKGLEAGGSDPLTDELLHLSRSHALAYARMNLYAEDGDPDHLRQGWLLISVSLPRIMELSKQLRERIGVKPTSTVAFGVTCFRCGSENPKGQKFCKKCNAMLPQTSQEATEYTDIIGGAPSVAAPPSGTPANVAKLAQLVQQIEGGQIGISKFQSEMDEQLRNADKVHQGFDRQVANMTGRNPSFDAYAQFFATQMESYIQGLYLMHSYAEN